MCGIVGIVDYAGRYTTTEIQKLTLAMREALSHRGPDDAGLWTSPGGRVCLGQRRLSILDLRPEGRQPMPNEDGSVVVSFNGEIYNFQDIRERLLEDGHKFRSRTDTEVLCHLFEGDPFEAVESLSGMFAFGVWNEPRRELTLARDHHGKKPLYYLCDGGFLAFASELTALQRLPGLVGDIDPAAIQEYLLLQYIHAPRTIYRNVRKLEPGTCLSLGFSSVGCEVRERRRQFWRFDAQEPRRSWFGTSPSSRSLVKRCREVIVAAVRDRLVADVPVGAFLSGGNDSSLVVAIMAKELGVRAKTFSIGFADSPASEHVAARQIATHLGTEHHELIVAPSAIEMLPTIVAALDEPNGDSSCLPMYLLSEYARRHVTVALSGDGGDEMFGGYGRYTDTVREASLRGIKYRWGRRRQTGQAWTPGCAYVGPRLLPMTEETLAGLAGGVLPAVRDLIAEFRQEADGPGPVLHRLRTLDARTYMPGAVLAKVDRMSMRFALEIRSPLLDRRVADFAAGLPASACNRGGPRTAKKMIKTLCLRYLPEEVVHRPKQGFGIPDQCWSQLQLLDLADDCLLDSGSRLTEYLDRDRLRAHLERQREPSSFHVYQIWELLVLEHWLRKAASSQPVPLAA